MRRLVLLAVLLLAAPLAQAQPAQAPGNATEGTPVDGVLDGIQDAGSAVGDGLSSVGEGIGSAAKGAGSAIGQAAAALGRAAGLALDAATDGIMALGAGASAALAAGVAALGRGILLLAHGAEVVFASIVVGGLDLLGAALQALGAGLVALGRALAALAAAAWTLVSLLRPQQMDRTLFAGAAAGGALATAAIGTWSLAALLQRLGWLAPLGIAGFSRIEDTAVLQHPIRAQLFQAIQANPGIHASALARVGDVGWGTVVHHLDRLEKAHMVAIRRVGGQKCYFENGGKVSRQDMAVASAVRSPTAGQIAAYVQDHPMTSQKAMAGTLGISAALTSFHVKKLVNLGVLARVRAGKESLLTATEAIRRVASLSQPAPAVMAPMQVA